MTTILVCDDVENLSIANELADVSSNDVVANRRLQRTALAVALFVAFHAQKHVVEVLTAKRCVRADGDERIEATLVVLPTIGL